MFKRHSAVKNLLDKEIWVTHDLLGRCQAQLHFHCDCAFSKVFKLFSGVNLGWVVEKTKIPGDFGEHDILFPVLKRGAVLELEDEMVPRMDIRFWYKWWWNIYIAKLRISTAICTTRDVYILSKIRSFVYFHLIFYFEWPIIWLWVALSFFKLQCPTNQKGHTLSKVYTTRWKM